MNEYSFREEIGLIATFTTLIPIFIGIIRYKTAVKPLRLFLFFLIYGFFTDLIVSPLIQLSLSPKYFLFILYSLIESAFLFWFIGYSNSYSLVKRISFSLAIAMIPFWFITEIVLSPWLDPSPIFDTAYQILISILSAYSLLKLAEEKIELQKLPMFWFMLGIFFYCFTTFFISIFIGEEIRNKIWFMRNLINLLLYAIFTIGFLTIPRPTKN